MIIKPAGSEPTSLASKSIWKRGSAAKVAGKSTSSARAVVDNCFTIQSAASVGAACPRDHLRGQPIFKCFVLARSSATRLKPPEFTTCGAQIKKAPRLHGALHCQRVGRPIPEWIYRCDIARAPRRSQTFTSSQADSGGAARKPVRQEWCKSWVERIPARAMSSVSPTG